MTEIINEKFETRTNEFKQVLGQGEEALSWLKTVNAFSNSFGGTLYVGVKNSNFEIIGLPKDLVDSTVQTFIREVKLHLNPVPHYSFKYIPLTNNPNLFVVGITVDKEENGPVILTYKGIPSIYVRDEGRNSFATRDDIKAIVLSSKANDYDFISTNSLFEREEFKLLFGTYKERTGDELTSKILSSIGFFDSSNMLRRGALLFSDAFNSNETLISITKWPSVDKGGNEFLNLGEYHENIISSIEKCLRIIKENVSNLEIKTEESRILKESYPTRSIFEGLINAFAHKNYFLENVPITIDIFIDRLEITSPGNLFDNRKLMNETDISSIMPSRRNQLISDVLCLLKFMEKKGSGFDKIANDYSQYPSEYKPSVTSYNNRFTLILPNLNYVGGIVKKENPNIKITFPTKDLYRKEDITILTFCYFKYKELKDIAQMLNVKVSSYLRGTVLKRLIDANLLYKLKMGNKDFYKTNTDVVKLLEQ